MPPKREHIGSCPNPHDHTPSHTPMAVSILTTKSKEHQQEQQGTLARRLIQNDESMLMMTMFIMAGLDNRLVPLKILEPHTRKPQVR